MRQRRLVHAIHFELPTAVGFQTNVFQRQRIGITGTAIGVQQAVCLQFLTGFQVHDDAVIAAFNLLILFVVANDHTAVPEVVRERVGHLLIEECQQTIAGVD